MSTRLLRPTPEADLWFVGHGLPWFVPERRAAARAALRSRHLFAGLAAIVVIGLALGVLLAWLTDEASFAPPTLITLVAVAAIVYAGTQLGAWPMARWAARRTLGTLRQLLPMVTRALPLLLIFMTFLFINAEVWQLAATLDGGVLWLTVLLFAAFAVLFLLVRLPDELDRVDHEIDDAALVRLCAGTPMAAYAEQVAAQPDDDVARPLHRMERTNLVLVLLVAQSLQVLLLAASVFAFFVLFGALVMKHAVQRAWTGGEVHALPWASNLSVELVQVSVFLAAFAGLYFTVYAVTDETYRDQFFTGVKAQLERAVGVRAVYLAARGG